jgi:hypothetical protein
MLLILFEMRWMIAVSTPAEPPCWSDWAHHPPSIPDGILYMRARPIFPEVI